MLGAIDVYTVLNGLIAAGKVPPMIVVAPSDGHLPTTDTEWENAPLNPAWEWSSFVADDLVRWTEAELPVCTSRRGHAIGGLSMGGFGAANVALHNLAVFSAVSAWSPYFIADTPAIEGPPGSVGWWENSPLEYLPSMIASLRRLPLRFSFYSSPDSPGWQSSVAFADLLSQYGIPYSFSLGGHDWATWHDLFPSQMLWLADGFHC